MASKPTMENLLEHATSKYALAVVIAKEARELVGEMKQEKLDDAQEKGEKFQSDKEPVTDYPTSRFVTDAIKEVAKGDVPYHFPEV